MSVDAKVCFGIFDPKPLIKHFSEGDRTLRDGIVCNTGHNFLWFESSTSEGLAFIQRQYPGLFRRHTDKRGIFVFPDTIEVGEKNYDALIDAHLDDGFWLITPKSKKGATAKRLKEGLNVEALLHADSKFPDAVRRWLSGQLEEESKYFELFERELFCFPSGVAASIKDPIKYLRTVMSENKKIKLEKFLTDLETETGIKFG
jgi:hypothetical protein